MSRTFPDALQQQASLSPGVPLVTFYDEVTGERVELSYATYGNWVAKTGSLMQDELGLARGDRVAIDLPTHWLATVWLGAAWSLGVAAGDASSVADADLVVCGPDGVATYAGGGTDVVACSLLPMGRRFGTPLPQGVTDFGEVVWAQPDSLLVLDPVSAQDTAWVDATAGIDHATLLSLADASPGRVATVQPPASRSGLARLVGPLLSGAGTVWVAGSPSPERLAELAHTERAEVDAG